MFFSSNRRERKPSFLKTLVNIATITSATITCIRLSIYGIFSITTTMVVILLVVVFVAIGNNIAKIVLACIALIIFVLLYSGGTNEGFYALLKSMTTLIIVLFGIYYMIRGQFKRSR